MARSVDRVVGIEMVPEAIVDAKANAKLNSKFDRGLAGLDYISLRSPYRH